MNETKKLVALCTALEKQYDSLQLALTKVIADTNDEKYQCYTRIGACILSKKVLMRAIEQERADILNKLECLSPVMQSCDILSASVINRLGESQDD